MKFLYKCPLLLILSVTAIAAEITGAVNLDKAYAGYEGKTVMTPPLGAVFWGIKEGVYPWSGEEQSVMAQVQPETQNQAANEEQTKEPVPDPQPEPQSQSEPQSEPQPQSEPEETQPPEEEKTYEFCRVEEDYFDDALFIGDSRTQGLLEYGGIEERATFYCRTSLTVYDLFAKEKAFIREEGEDLTLTQALERHSFGKIYLMVGINEMGTGTPESFFEEYARAVYRIRQLQPQAIVFVEGIMRVAGEKSPCPSPSLHSPLRPG